jgi:hypothetical protein
MGKTYVVQKVPYLEGFKGIAFNRDSLEASLQNLDVRIVALEKTLKIHTPPPTLEPDWESLEFRTRRLCRKIYYTRALQMTATGDATEEKIKPEILSKTLLRLGIGAQGKALPDDPVDFNAACQELCHMAGRNSIRIPNLIQDNQQLYETAVELFLALEPDFARGRGIPPPAFPPGGPPPRGLPPIGAVPLPPKVTKKNIKSCCGCCSCYCHVPPPAPARTSIFKKRPRALSFEWLRRLFGMKTKTYDYETDSSSSTLSVASSYL